MDRHATIWRTSLARKYAATIDEVERAVRDCPDPLWEESLWEVKRDHPFVWPVRRIDDKRGGDAASQDGLLQVYSAFWNVAYHALFHLDFYLSGAVLKGFTPPAPFREDEHRAHVVPNRPYTRAELQQYIAYNREKARATIEALTDEQAERVVPRAGVPFAEFLLSNLLHAQEHAAQLNLFLGQKGARSMSAFESKTGVSAEQGRQILRDGVLGRTDAEIDAFAKPLGGYTRLLPLVFTGLCSRIEARESCTVVIDAGSSFVVRVRPGGATFDRRVPKNVDATISVRPQHFLRWMVGDLDLIAATADGRVTIDGDTAAVRRLFEAAPGAS